MARTQRRQAAGLGVMLLANQLKRVGLDQIPPITLSAIIGQAALFLGLIPAPWERHEVCLSGESILVQKDYKRLVLSAIEHADDLHLYHNMVSFIFKGRTLESRYGSRKFLVLLLIFTLATSSMYVALVKMAAEYFHDWSHMRTCAIGFSGVLFALKVLTTYHSEENYKYIYGFKFPSKLAVWIELIIIHLMVPRSSFVGHLAGILVGLLYIMGPLRLVVDVVDGMINVPPNPDSQGQRLGSGSRPSGRWQSPQDNRAGTDDSHGDRWEPQYGWNIPSERP
ncbi:rhomboid-related protein 4-like [Oratosquilla oratoria]|uniref:rhomboid-related protein 4-like n=1 Tax=Oratosquilla oratoria TaxID=337810 RepID=UPI003F75B335